MARASLEELKLDYEDFLRQRNLPRLDPEHPVLMRFKRKRSVSFSSSTLAANAALSLLNLTGYLLDHQVESQAADFKKRGGFTERLYRIRMKRRGKSS
mgnify:CR=1 FL=1